MSDGPVIGHGIGVVAFPKDTLHPPGAMIDCIGKLTVSNVVETVDGIRRSGQGGKRLFPVLVGSLINKVRCEISVDGHNPTFSWNSLNGLHPWRFDG